MSAPIPAQSKHHVWVMYEDPQFGIIGAQKHVSEATEDEIIRCAECDKPACVLDHFYPYHREMNACKEHAGRLSREILDIQDLQTTQ